MMKYPFPENFNFYEFGKEFFVLFNIIYFTNINYNNHNISNAIKFILGCFIFG